MIAANRRGNGGGRARRTARRVGGAIRRHAPKVEHVGGRAGPVLALYGAVNGDGWKPDYGQSAIAAAASGDLALAKGRITSTIPFTKTQFGGARSQNRAIVGAGLALTLLPAARKLPLVGPILRRITRIKIGRKTYVLGA